jgi:low affinity Fe/Cu permease
VVAAVLVIVSLLTMDVEETNLAISIVTLLMVLVLQNTQNRDSAALHLKLDEVVRAEPEARDEIRGAESRSAAEIGELTREDRTPSCRHRMRCRVSERPSAVTPRSAPATCAEPCSPRRRSCRST